MAVSANGRWLAATTNESAEIALYDIQKQFDQRMGSTLGVPKTIGWSADGKGVTWGYKNRPPKDWHKALRDGLDLAKLEHLSRKELDAARGGGKKLPAGMSYKFDKGKTFLVRGNKQTPINLPASSPAPDASTRTRRASLVCSWCMG